MSDILSTFSYDSDEDASPHTFSLAKLEEAVRSFFRIKECKLVKLAEGGYHKENAEFICLTANFNLKLVHRFTRYQLMMLQVSWFALLHLHFQKIR